MFTQGRTWDQFVPFAVSHLNNSISESLGVAPNEVVFGRCIKTALDVFRDGLENKINEEPISVQRYLQQLQEMLTTLRTFVHEPKQKLRYDQNIRPKIFKEGDSVALLVPGR